LETSFGTKLRISIELVRKPFVSSSKPPPLPRENPSEWLKELLVTLYWIILPSVPLMRAASERCIALAANDESKLLIELARYFNHHVEEEMNHDEWLLQDLEVLGVSRQVALSNKPPEPVAELVGSQYYWIYHWHPVCLLGYIALLEGNPPSRELIDRLKKVTGAPDAALRTLIEHSDLDTSHSDELFAFIDSLPLSKKHEQWIRSNAFYTALKLAEMQDKLAVI
jgi:hypothetical protein